VVKTAASGRAAGSLVLTARRRGHGPAGPRRPQPKSTLDFRAFFDGLQVDSGRPWRTATPRCHPSR